MRIISKDRLAINQRLAAKGLCHAMPFGREMRSRRRVVGEQTTKPNVTPSPPLP